MPNLNTSREIISFARQLYNPAEIGIQLIHGSEYTNAVNRLVAFNQSSIIAFHNACGIYRDYLCDYPLCGEA